MSSVPTVSVNPRVTPGPDLLWIPSLRDKSVILDLRSRPDLTPAAKEVWAFLIRAFRAFHGNLYCSERYIAQEVGYSVRTIRRALRQLESAALLRLTPRRRRPKPNAPHGGNGPSTWQFHPTWRPYQAPADHPSSDCPMTGGDRTECPPPWEPETVMDSSLQPLLRTPIEKPALQDVNQRRPSEKPRQDASSPSPAGHPSKVVATPQNQSKPQPVQEPSSARIPDASTPEGTSETGEDEPRLRRNPASAPNRSPALSTGVEHPEKTPSSGDGDPVTARLIGQLGYRPMPARKLVLRFGPTRVQRVLDWIAAAPTGAIRYPKAWLMTALTDDYDEPSWVSERQRKHELARKRQQELAQESAARAREELDRRREVSETEQAWATLHPLLSGPVGACLSAAVHERLVKRLPNAFVRQTVGRVGSPVWRAIWLEVWHEAGCPTQ